jgi:hypothetical protein
LSTALPLAGELRSGAERRRLRCLTTGVGVDLGVEHQDVDVVRHRQHVVETAKADVERPAVAADQPHALRHQVVRERSEFASCPASTSVAGNRRCAARSTRVPLAAMPRFAAFGAWLEQRHQCVTERAWRPPCSSSCARAVSASTDRRMPRPNSALSSNSELAHAGPRPCGIGRVRRRRQVAAVDRRAAGGVGDQQPIAEQLRQQLEVRRLAAARAGARELEQRLQQLRALHVELRWRHRIEFRQRCEEEVEARTFAVAHFEQRRHVDRLVARIGLVLRRTDLHAQSAAGAVVGCDLEGVA